MKAPQIIVIVVALVVAVYLAEHLFGDPPYYSDRLLAWNNKTLPGQIRAEAPPETVGASAQSTLTHGAQVDAANSKPMEQAWIEAQETGRRDFTDFLHEVKERLPTKDKVGTLTVREVHGRPDILKASAADLGEIAQRIENTPSLAIEGLEFYKSCALNSEVFVSIRALCFNRAQLLSVDLHQEIWDFDPKQIPRDVIELAKKL